jgi:modification methylase
MKQLDDRSIDLIVTSPPYNLRNTVGGGFTAKKGIWNNPKGLYKGYGKHDDNMPYDEYVAWQRACLDEMMRVLKGSGAIFYNHKWRVQKGLIQDRHEIVGDFPVRQIIIWWRKSGMNFNDGYFVPTYEVIYLIAKPHFKLKKGANGLGDVWVIGPEKGNEHPAPFPNALVHNCISSTDASTVLDPFIGSGTTAIVCKQLGRHFIGFDINPDYVKFANDRLKQSVVFQDNGGKDY